MPKHILGKRIGTMLFTTGTLSRCLSSQTFNEKKFPVTPEQFLILSLLVENKELYQRQISEITLKDRANVSRIINILENKGYVKRTDDSNGRKIHKITVTEKGKELADFITPTTMELRKIITKDIKTDELEFFLEIMDKIYRNIRDKVNLQI